MVVKVGGMCWVMSTGKRSITGRISATRLISACGPPVEEPISSARGASVLNGRLSVDPARDHSADDNGIIHYHNADRLLPRRAGGRGTIQRNTHTSPTTAHGSMGR